jgi:hypothetical protein
MDLHLSEEQNQKRMVQEEEQRCTRARMEESSCLLRWQLQWLASDATPSQ